MTTDVTESGLTLRQRAEARLNSGAAAAQPVQSLAEANLLLHELRVHQIELELQNEELRRTQIEMDASRARYFDLYDLAPVGYVTVGATGLILEANLTATTLLGVTRGALVQQPFSRFILKGKEDQELYYRHRQQLLATGESQTCELRMVREDGTVFWAQLAATAAADVDGNSVCRIALHDITERQRAEEALCASQAFAHQILNSMDDTIAVLDGDGVILAVNDAWRNFALANGHALGKVAPQADIGQNYLTVCLASLGSQVADEATDAANAAAGIRGVLNGRLSSYSQEYACHSPKQQRWFSMNVTSLGTDGRGAVIAHTNITARQQAQRELVLINSCLEQRVAERTQALALANVQLGEEIVARVLMVEELQASERKSVHIQQLLNHAECLATLGTLVASVAHEIRNANQSALDNAAVMVGIWQEVRPILDRYARENGPFQLMGLTYPVRREAISNLVQGIEAGTRRTANIIGELKNLARPRSATSSSMADNIGLAAVVASAITLTAGMHGVATGRFVTHYRPDLPPVRGSFQRLEQVLINLLQNACRALTDPRQTIRVSTDYDAVGHRVLCHVQDEGVGILPEHQERLFEPFFTTHAASGGTGLGLSLCEKIIMEHGGTISIASEPAQGTTVSVSLPAYGEASQPQLSLNLG